MARGRKAEAQVVIVAKDEASGQVKKAEGTFKGFGKFLAVGFVGAAVAAGAAIVALAKKFGEAVTAAGEQELALKRVETSLRAIGDTAPEATKEMADWAQALQGATTVGDETILTLSRLAISFTNNAEQARELVEASLDFAEGAGIAQEEALRRLGRSLGGSAADVANFDSRIRELTLSQLANGDAIDLIAEKYEGFAAQTTQTYLGALKQLENAQNDTTEAVGDTATKNQELIEVINQRTAAELKLTKTLEGGSTIGGKILVLWNKTLLVLKQYETAILDANRAHGQLSLAQREALETTEQTTKAFKAFNDGIRSSHDTLSDFISEEELAENQSKRYAEQLLSLVEAQDAENESIQRAIEVEQEINELRGITTEETGKAEAQQDDYNDSLDAAVESGELFVDVQRRLQDSLRVTNQLLAENVSQFDAILAAQGRAAAVQAGLAAGGTISGNRISLAGGSRFITDPGFGGTGGGGLSAFGQGRTGAYSDL